MLHCIILYRQFPIPREIQFKPSNPTHIFILSIPILTKKKKKH